MIFLTQIWLTFNTVNAQLWSLNKSSSINKWRWDRLNFLQALHILASPSKYYDSNFYSKQIIFYLSQTASYASFEYSCSRFFLHRTEHMAFPAQFTRHLFHLAVVTRKEHTEMPFLNIFLPTFEHWSKAHSDQSLGTSSLKWV